MAVLYLNLKALLMQNRQCEDVEIYVDCRITLKMPLSNIKILGEKIKTEHAGIKLQTELLKNLSQCL